MHVKLHDKVQCIDITEEIVHVVRESHESKSGRPYGVPQKCPMFDVMRLKYDHNCNAKQFHFKFV